MRRPASLSPLLRWIVFSWCGTSLWRSFRPSAVGWAFSIPTPTAQPRFHPSPSPYKASSYDSPHRARVDALLQMSIADNEEDEDVLVVDDEANILDDDAAPPPTIPITILSGFLGAGKTTLLRHLLHNRQGLKIALLVNDMAALNIDSQLLADPRQQPQQQQQQQPQDTTTPLSDLVSDKDATTSSLSSSTPLLELQNGCACCTQSEEFLASLAQLVTLNDCRTPAERFDHIVVELSGIADPRAIRAQWQDAQLYDMPLTHRLTLDTFVTIVDATTFVDHLTMDDRTMEPRQVPELFGIDGTEEESTPLLSSSSDDKDIIPPSLWQTLQGSPHAGADSEQSLVGLLVAQVETADVVLVNKIDLVQEEQQRAENPTSSSMVASLRRIIATLTGPRATVYETSHARLDNVVAQVLGVARGQGVVLAGPVDDHQDAVLAAAAATQNHDEEQDAHNHHHHHHHDADQSKHHHSEEDRGDAKEEAANHTHQHEHHSHHSSCDERDHSHEHIDHHSHEHEHTDHHDHSHKHTDHHSHGHEHTDHHSHTHSHHEHSHSHDDHHDHTHSHDHSHAGIGSFVYEARRPFHPTRMAQLLRYMSLSLGVPTIPDMNNNMDDDSNNRVPVPLELSLETQNALGQIVRSKGFCWLAHSHQTAYFWSHAGKAFELQILGSWWATLAPSEWPPEALETIRKDFLTEEEDPRTASLIGDRRQAIVWIGIQVDQPARKRAIVDALDQCLLTDDEWNTYQQNAQAEQRLDKFFPSPFTSKILPF